MAPSNDSYIYAGDDAGNIYVTTNGGTSWHKGTFLNPTTKGMVRGLAVDPTQPNVVYASFADFATGAGQHVFESDDAGQHWYDISSGLPNIPFSSVLVVNSAATAGCAAGRWIVAGSDVGVFCSADNGKTWTQLGTGLPNVAIDQVFSNVTGTKLFLATHGRGMWELSLTAPGACGPGGTGVLLGTAVVSQSSAWAVGYCTTLNGPVQTLTEHWDGSSWGVVASPNPGQTSSELFGVAVVSSSDVWAVGLYSNNGGILYQTLTEHWNGTSWSAVTSPNPGQNFNQLFAVAVVSSSDVWAVGEYYSNAGPELTLTEHWNGTSWSAVTSPNGPSGNELFGVAALSSSDVWAVGEYYSSGVYQTLAEHWNGTSWSVVTSPNPGQSDVLNRVAVVSSSDVWAVGYADLQTLAEHWNGTSWSVVASSGPGKTSNVLNAVAVVSSSDVWAVGWYSNNGGPQQTLTEHWNGTSWSVVASPNTGQSDVLNAVATVSSSDVWAVGNYYDSNGNAQTLTEHWNGTSWSVMPSP